MTTRSNGQRDDRGIKAPLVKRSYLCSRMTMFETHVNSLQLHELRRRFGLRFRRKRDAREWLAHFVTNCLCVVQTRPPQHLVVNIPLAPRALGGSNRGGKCLDLPLI